MIVKTGVPGQGISACCDFTAWEYFCDQGCVQIVGGSYTLLLVIVQVTQIIIGGLPGPCGWDFVMTHWYQPCSGGTGFPGSTTCVPCYTSRLWTICYLSKLLYVLSTTSNLSVGFV